VEKHVLRGLRRLERSASDLLRARATVSQRDRRHHSGNLYDVRLELSLPGRDVVVSRTAPPHRESETLVTAIGEAFDKARRLLLAQRAERRGEVKTHEPPEEGEVTDVMPDYGFIQAIDGHTVYFHRNSVLADGWSRLEVGSEVRFVEEMGNEGPQASAVTVTGPRQRLG
jgi:cold shock CspA family protein